ncbi:hypothetical protein, partial [Methylobacterium radiotolerans]|uniref:hypothetical protein n=1 Tax=Methylobacterium radiotolerans TaxID=31998 RepID=UPI001AEC882A
GVGFVLLRVFGWFLLFVFCSLVADCCGVGMPDLVFLYAPGIMHSCKLLASLLVILLILFLCHTLATAVNVSFLFF